MEHVGGAHALTENTGRQKQGNLHFGNVAADNQTRERGKKMRQSAKLSASDNA